jgi:RimJ/RimL family protein N-acetyltransferase
MSAIIRPILVDFPDFYATERLHIRSLLPGDGAIMHEAVSETREALEGWMQWEPQRRSTLDACEDYVRQARVWWILRDGFEFGIFRKEDGRLVGRIAAHHIDWAIPQFEVGYWTRSTETGKGYMTEAVNGLVAFLREHFGALRIEIWCDEQNTASRRVAERAGFVPMCRSVNAYRWYQTGELRNDLGFEKVWNE